MLFHPLLLVLFFAAIVYGADEIDFDNFQPIEGIFPSNIKSVRGEFTINQGRSVLKGEIEFRPFLYNVHVTTTEGVGTFDFNEIEQGCVDNGLVYRIHDSDANCQGGNSFDRSVGTFDPSLACSPRSNSPFCDRSENGIPANFSETCVTPSFALEPAFTFRDYTCNFNIYRLQPFTCEVGDLSGKFNPLMTGRDPRTGNTRGLDNEDGQPTRIFDEFGASPQQLDKKTVVFSCSSEGATPVACAKLESTVNPPGAQLFYPADFIDGEVPLLTGGKLFVSFVDIGIKGNVRIRGKKYNIQLDLTDALDEIKLRQPNCFDGGLKYHIHERWDQSDPSRGSFQCDVPFTGGHWDPTVACHPDTDSRFCRNTINRLPQDDGCVVPSHTLRPNDLEYECDYGRDPHSCGVSDLDGKSQELIFNKEDNTISTNGWIEDPYFPRHSNLLTRAFVIHCSNTERIFCGEIRVDEGPFPPASPGPANGRAAAAASNEDVEDDTVTIVVVVVVVVVILTLMVAFHCYISGKCNPEPGKNYSEL